MEMTAGEVHSRNDDAVEFAQGTLTMTGGKISGSYGIWNSGSGTRVLTLGKDDGTVSTTIPEITVNSTGISTSIQTVNFYDGKVTNGSNLATRSGVNVPSGYKVVVNGTTATLAVEDPPIPTGFTHTEGTIETGYVIKNNTDNNEFVWIPVDDISEFVREEGYQNNAKQSMLQYCTEPYSYNGATANATETAEYNAMISSVEEYKGFYIARYEASQGTDGKAKSIKGKMPWTNIGWNNDNTMQTQTGGAVEKARAVYPVSSATKGSAVSTLVYGVQWDRAVNYITDGSEELKKDSRTFGNHKDSESFEYTKEDGTTGTKTKDTGVKIPTGSDTTNRNQLKNVYDMAGNVYEWTMEAYYSNNRVLRGGSYAGSGILYPVSVRDFSNGPSKATVGIGFRVALYIAE